MRVRDAMNKVMKWRSIFAGWQLGTRAKGDPECDAVRDHRELTIALRVEVNALTATLVEKGVITNEEFLRSVEYEARLLDKAYEQRFPGISTSDIGVTLTAPECIETMRGWKP